MSETNQDTPPIKRPRRRWLRRLCLGLLLVLVLPYAESRVFRSSRQIIVQQVSGIEPAPPASDSTLRIACYNIAHGRGLADSNWEGGTADQRSKRLGDIATLLRRINADIVVLNEVDFDCSWSGRIDQAEFLAKQSGYRYVAKSRSIDARLFHLTWRHGVAVLSKYPVTAAEEVDYPAFVRWEAMLFGKKRGLVCQMERAGEKLRIAAVHLSHRDESTRNGSAEMLDQIAGRESDGPLILAGDFNSAPAGVPGHVRDALGDNAIETLDRGEQFRRLPVTAASEDALTFPANKPDRLIDWIMIPRQWRFHNYEALPSTLSDHRPVVADVTIIGDQP